MHSMGAIVANTHDLAALRPSGAKTSGKIGEILQTWSHSFTQACDKRTAALLGGHLPNLLFGLSLFLVIPWRDRGLYPIMQPLQVLQNLLNINRAKV